VGEEIMGTENECDGRATFASILGRGEDDPHNERDYYFMFVPLMTTEQKERYFDDFPEMREKYREIVSSIKKGANDKAG
jgi:hypothetical protein